MDTYFIENYPLNLGPCMFQYEKFQKMQEHIRTLIIFLFYWFETRHSRVSDHSYFHLNNYNILVYVGQIFSFKQVSLKTNDQVVLIIFLLILS